MNGEELKQYIKRSGMSVAAVAEKLGPRPQNLNANARRLAGITPSCFIQKLSASSRSTKGKRRFFVSLIVSRTLILQRS